MLTRESFNAPRPSAVDQVDVTLQPFKVSFVSSIKLPKLLVEVLPLGSERKANTAPELAVAVQEDSSHSHTEGKDVRLDGDKGAERAFIVFEYVFSDVLIDNLEL